MDRQRLHRRATTVVAFAAPALLVTNLAYAAWSVQGQGTGSAAATTSQDMTVKLAEVSGLYPGASQTVTMTVGNPNPFPVEITGITFGEVTTTAEGCTTHGVSFAGASQQVVPASQGETAGTVDVDVTVKMDNTSVDGCQGATFTTTVTVSGQSATPAQ